MCSHRKMNAFACEHQIRIVSRARTTLTDRKNSTMNYLFQIRHVVNTFVLSCTAMTSTHSFTDFGARFYALHAPNTHDRIFKNRQLCFSLGFFASFTVSSSSITDAALVSVWILTLLAFANYNGRWETKRMKFNHLSCVFFFLLLVNLHSFQSFRVSLCTHCVNILLLLLLPLLWLLLPVVSYSIRLLAHFTQEFTNIVFVFFVFPFNSSPKRHFSLAPIYISRGSCFAVHFSLWPFFLANFLMNVFVCLQVLTVFAQLKFLSLSVCLQRPRRRRRWVGVSSVHLCHS